MHSWGDKGVDWSGISHACEIIQSTCIRYSRLGGHAKEKYGTVRFYVMFEGFGIHSLLYPGYHYYQFSPKIRKLERRVSYCLHIIFGNLWFRWQKAVYSYAYNKAVKKYPHLSKEILCMADYPEYIKNYKEML